MNAVPEEIINILNSLNPNRSFNGLESDAHFSDVDIDSLDQMDLLLGVEEKYQIKIPDDVVETLNCIDAIIAYLNNLSNDSQAN